MDRRERIAHNLRDLISEAGYQQQDFAAVLGVSTAALSKWLRGETELRLEDANRMAQALEMRFALFLEQIGYTDPAGFPATFDDWSARARERRRTGQKPAPQLPVRDVKRPGAHITARRGWHTPSNQREIHQPDGGDSTHTSCNAALYAAS